MNPFDDAGLFPVGLFPVFPVMEFGTIFQFSTANAIKLLIAI